MNVKEMKFAVAFTNQNGQIRTREVTVTGEPGHAIRVHVQGDGKHTRVYVSLVNNWRPSIDLIREEVRKTLPNECSLYEMRECDAEQTAKLLSLIAG